MITEAVHATLQEIAGGNCFHEPITLVAAVKTRTREEIEEAVRAGITDIGDNRVQEFREKSIQVPGVTRHFIGRLQTNKVKYLVGQCDLIHSLDRDELLTALEARAAALGIVQDVLIEINLGEASKGGYPLRDGLSAFRNARKNHIRPMGFMAMLPAEGDAAMLGDLCDRVRALYDRARAEFPDVKYLSLGMSGDWRLCVAHGSNMIRLGTSLFGPRPVQ